MDNNIDKSSCDETTVEDKDEHEELEKLKAQITVLESEKKKSDEQFGVQRGKMKELLLQNEEDKRRLAQQVEVLRKELDDSKSEMTVAGLNFETKLEEERRRAQEEVTSLEQILAATLEESSKTEAELKNLKLKNEKLEAELAKVTPGVVFTTIARKVASQLGATDAQQQPETLEDSMRKAKEDAEVLKSLVVPLEEEIAALKTKLRDTDTQLRRYQASEASVSSPTGDTLSVPQGDRPSGRCDMCSNYECQLVTVENALVDSRKSTERVWEELDREVACRKQMELKWQDKKEQHKIQVTELQAKLTASEKILEELRGMWNKTKQDIDKQFEELRADRHSTQLELERVQKENDTLMGKYTAHSDALQDEEINLPGTVEAMQEMWLQKRDDLIKARVGQERLEESVRSLERLWNDSVKKGEELTDQMGTLRSEMNHRDALLSQKDVKLRDQEMKIQSLKHEVGVLQSRLNIVNSEKKHLEENEAELKSRLISLQTGLENGEAVQKDFVLLSQSLQKELESLKAQNNVLRWEYEDDVTECRGCEQPFKSSKGKLNCRHCGRIFCSTCLSHSIKSGPSSRESRVCNMCHTLLNKDSPPYFSLEPPHSKHH